MASVHFGRLVGTGGFAKTVAIKRLHPVFARDEAFRKMILDEARLAARVRHPNVVPPLDVLAEGGELLLVMEYVHGESLARLLRASVRAGERVPLPVGAAILSNVLHGLHAAHEARDEEGQPLDIVHRDMSPQNIIVGVDGVARVIDFGIAKAVTSEELTSAGTIKGKLPYLAPEQLEGDPATKRSDLYATAVVFWEVLAGRRLFDGEDGEILRKIMSMEVPPPSAFNALVPRTVDDVVRRGLSRDPEARYATAREMALELEAAVLLATASAVGAWTERLAAATLAERAAQIAAVETSSVSSVGSALASSPPPRIAPLASSPPPHLAPPAAGVLNKPEVLIRNVEWLPPTHEKPVTSSFWRRFLGYLAAFLLVALILTFMFAPALARAWIVTGAAARGVVVTIERVDVSRRAIRLSDLHAEAAELPRSSLRAGTLEIGLRFFVPERLTLDDVEVSLDGSYVELEAQLDAYRAKHPRVFAETVGSLQKIEITSGRVVWKGLVGAGTSALVENITLDLTKVGVRPLGEDYHLTAPLFTLRLADAAVGPWQLDVERQGILARGVVHFDPTHTYPAAVTRTAADDGSVSMSFDVPKTALSDLHLPAALFGGRASARTRLEAHGEIELVPGRAPARLSRSASGHLRFGAYGLSVFPAGPLIDLALDLGVSGDAARPLPLTATLGIGQADTSGGANTSVATATLPGTLDLSGRVARLDLAGKVSSLPCVRPPTTGPGAPAAAAVSAASRAPTTGLAASLAASLDDYPGATVTLQPLSTCTPTLR
jgi:serine/threonine-protein kinase